MTDADRLRRLEDKLDRLSFAVRCLLGYHLAGEHTDRAAERAQMEQALHDLDTAAPPGQEGDPSAP